MGTVDVCVECENMLGESPVWDVEQQRLYWLDSMKQEIWRCAADGSEVQTWSLPKALGDIGCMALRAGGGAVLAGASGIHLFDFATQALERVAHPTEGFANLRINDGKVDSRGRLVFGSIDFDLVFPQDGAASTPRGAIYRLDADHSVTRIADDLIISNGPCWSPDSQTFYFADSWRDMIYAYPWDEDAGTLGERRTFATLPPRSIPDGATVDAEGYLWSTVNGAYSGEGALIRFAPDGRIERKIALPVAKTTSVMFGGPALDVIYVTSSRIAGGQPDQPLDGALFAIRGLGIRGRPERRFAG